MVKFVFYFCCYLFRLRARTIRITSTLSMRSLHSVRFLLFIFHFLLLPSCVAAQEMKPGEVRHSYMLGVGAGNVLDTYLSPYSYRGLNTKLMFESLSPCRTSIFGEGDYLYNTQLTVDCSLLDNHTKNVKGYAGGVRWNIGVLRQLYANGRFRIFAGPMANAYVGGVYNSRNGNNPAQLKLSVTLDARMKAMYDFDLWELPVHADYSLSIPLLGVAHAPEFGESYYELYKLEGNRNGMVFVYPGNMPSMRHLLTFEVPVKAGHKIRFGYSGDLMQSKINDIKYHSYTNTFMVGMTSTLFRK